MYAWGRGHPRAEGQAWCQEACSREAPGQGLIVTLLLSTYVLAIMLSAGHPPSHLIQHLRQLGLIVHFTEGQTEAPGLSRDFHFPWGSQLDHHKSPRTTRNNNLFLKLTAEIFLKKGMWGSPYARSKEAGESQSSRHWDPGMSPTAPSPGAHCLGGRQRKAVTVPGRPGL